MARIDIDAVRTRVKRWWPAVEYVPSIESTNTALLAGGRGVLIAGEQTAGKGRMGRAWVSPPQAQLALSALIDDPMAANLGLMPLAIGLAATDAVPGAVLKWPNDLLLNGKKLAGILAEADFSDPAHPRVVVGIGLNVALTEEQLPVPHATSLALEGIDYDWTELATSLIFAMGRRLEQWRLGDPELLNDYRAVCITIGQEVRLEAPGGNIIGTVNTVNDAGEVVVDGVGYSAGDVTHLRPHV